MRILEFKPKSSAKVGISIVVLMGTIFTSLGFEWLFTDMQGDWGIPVFFILLGFFILFVAIYRISKSYRRIILSDEGFQFGRRVYPWDQVALAGGGKDRVHLRVAFIPVTVRTESYYHLLLGPREGEKVKQIKLVSSIFPYAYSEILYQIKERNKGL